MTAPAPHPESGTRTSSHHPSILQWNSLNVQVAGVGDGDAEDVGRMEKYSEVSVRGSELTVNGGIQAGAAHWPHRGGIRSGQAASMHSSTAHQPGTLSSVLDKALAGGSNKQKDRTVSDGASGAGVDGHRPAHSHLSPGMVAGVATMLPTESLVPYRTP